MTSPAGFFGGSSDGAMRMEEWLYEMCEGCRHGRTEDGLAGMGCDLPATAYAFPHGDILEWSPDADPAGPMGLRCMKWERRLRPGPVVGEEQLTLDVAVPS